jgi:hypothetical protein
VAPALIALAVRLSLVHPYRLWPISRFENGARFHDAGLAPAVEPIDREAVSLAEAVFGIESNWGAHGCRGSPPISTIRGGTARPSRSTGARLKSERSASAPILGEIEGSADADDAAPYDNDVGASGNGNARR